MSAGNNRFDVLPAVRQSLAGLAFVTLLTPSAPTVCRAETEPELTAAIRSHNVKQVVRILSEGADINARDESMEQTPLMWAAQSGDAGMVLTLIVHGATVNAQDDAGQTALMLAAGKGNSRVVKVLLENGANIALRDARGATAFALAQSKGHSAVARMITQASGRNQSTVPKGRLARNMVRHNVVASR